MHVLVATDGSKYGQWGLNWVATLPFVTPPRVTALHVLDSAWLRGPFRTRPEILRVEARSARTLKKVKQQLAALKLKGTVRKEQGAVAPVILKRAPTRDGLLVVGSQGLDALDRFLLGSVSTKLIQHAACPVLVVKGEAAPLRRMILAIDGSDASATALEFVLTRLHPNRTSGKGGRVPMHVRVIHVMAPSPWLKSQELKEANLKVIDQSVRKLITAGFTAEPLYQLGNPAEEIMKVAA
jgi:nucleotide-binding universal stress UspA family protein